MLSKLLKHEFKATARMMLPLYLVLAVLTVVDRAVLSIDFRGNLSVITSLAQVAYGISIVAILAASFVIAITRFYKNLMSDEGYLMFTLPVRPRQLISSKLIVSVVWIVASVLAVCLSLMGTLGIKDFIEGFKAGFSININNMKLTFGDRGFVLLMVEFVLMIFFGVLQSILMIYTSIALGQLFKGHRQMGSFLAYIIINTVLQILVILVMVLMGNVFGNSFERIESLPQIIFPIIIAYTIIMSLIFFFATDFIFRKKLNLE